MNHLVTRADGHAAPAFESKPNRELQVHWARHLDEVRAAQRLRHEVFFGEWRHGYSPRSTDTTFNGGVPHAEALDGLDQDEFDDHCEHLLVSVAATDELPAQVVGTYRVLLPESARRIGRYYTETEFDLDRLHDLRPTMAELGRSCIAAPWRTGGVILLLWSHLTRFLLNNGVRQAVGCASVPMHDGGVNAARVWRELRHAHLAPAHRRVSPRVALPVHLLSSDGEGEWPPLVKGYIKVGSKVLGAPAWDADFGCADLPMLLDFQDMSPAYRRRFMAG